MEGPPAPVTPAHHGDPQAHSPALRGSSSSADPQLGMACTLPGAGLCVTGSSVVLGQISIWTGPHAAAASSPSPNPTWGRSASPLAVPGSPGPCLALGELILGALGPATCWSGGTACGSISTAAVLGRRVGFPNSGSTHYVGRGRVGHRPEQSAAPAAPLWAGVRRLHGLPFQLWQSRQDEPLPGSWTRPGARSFASDLTEKTRPNKTTGV